MTAGWHFAEYGGDWNASSQARVVHSRYPYNGYVSSTNNITKSTLDNSSFATYSTLRYRGLTVGDAGTNKWGLRYRGTSSPSQGIRTVQRKREYMYSGCSACNTGDIRGEEYDYSSTDWYIQYKFPTSAQIGQRTKSGLVQMAESLYSHKRDVWWTPHMDYSIYIVEISAGVRDDGEMSKETHMESIPSDMDIEWSSSEDSSINYRDAFSYWSGCSLMDEGYSLYALYLTLDFPASNNRNYPRTFFINNEMGHPGWKQQRCGFMIAPYAVTGNTGASISEAQDAMNTLGSRIESYFASNRSTTLRWTDFMRSLFNDTDLSCIYHPGSIWSRRYGGIAYYINRNSMDNPTRRINCNICINRGNTGITAKQELDYTDILFWNGNGSHSGLEWEPVGAFNWSACVTRDEFLNSQANRDFLDSWDAYEVSGVEPETFTLGIWSKWSACNYIAEAPDSAGAVVNRDTYQINPNISYAQGSWNNPLVSLVYSSCHISPINSWFRLGVKYGAWIGQPLTTLNHERPSTDWTVYSAGDNVPGV